MLKEVTYYQDGEEVTVKLPHKNEVCPRCEGHGTHLNPNIGLHVYTPEEFEESFPEDEDKQQYFQRGGIYDVPCEQCGGKNVILVVDGDACTSPELKEHLKLFLAYEEERIQDEADDRMTQWYEDGCPRD
jgi:hypothetical protein